MTTAVLEPSGIGFWGKCPFDVRRDLVNGTNPTATNDPLNLTTTANVDPVLVSTTTSTNSAAGPTGSLRWRLSPIRLTRPPQRRTQH